MKIAIIHANDGSDVRVGKTCRSLCALGHDVHFLGWDRRPEAVKQVNLGAARRHVLVHRTPYGKATLTGNLTFVAWCAKHLSALRPAAVCAVNEDTALFVLPFKGTLYRHLVCDVFDALEDRHSDKPAVHRCILRAISTASRIAANRLIATDAARFERFGRFRRKTTIIENFPEDPGPALSRIEPEGTIKIWAGGTLTERRGLKQLLAAVAVLPDTAIVAAGWPYDAFSEQFVSHPRVDFKGIVTAETALALAASCDAVFCYYDPASLNNRFASPNKVYDAMAIGRPVIINTEVELAGWVVDQRVGFAAPYDDVGALATILGGLKVRRSALPEFARHSRSVFDRGYSWQRMHERLAKLYSGLESPG